MRSSAGSNRFRGRPAVPLAALALTALALAVLVAYASTLKLPQRASGPAAGPHEAPAERFGRPGPAATAGPRRVPPTAQPVVAPPGTQPRQAPSLWTLLTPWALSVDALALAGFAAVLALRGAQRGGRR